MNAHSLIYTTRSRSGHLVDVVLTVCGWLVFLFLFAAGLFNLIFRDSHPSQELLSPLWAGTSHTLMFYALMAFVNTSVLIVWALYNYRRFSGKERRQKTQPLPHAHLHASFDLSCDLLERTHDARVMTIAHEDDSRIRAINIIGQTGLPEQYHLAPAPDPTPETTAAPHPAQASPLQTKHYILGRIPRYWRWQQTTLPSISSVHTDLNPQWSGVVPHTH